MASPTPEVGADREIQADVLDELAWEHHIRPTEIGVIVKDGVVTLTGTVDSFVSRWAAQEAAHRVRRVTAVANDIDVRLPSIAERTDGELASACLYALKWDALIPTAALDVTVSKGWVTLKGAVDWEAQRQSAELVIGRLSGVVGVTNQLTVRPHPTPDDVKQRIERALLRSAEIDAKGITIDVHDGTVTLQGTVTSYVEKRAAQQAAWLAPGISAVNNQIKVVVPAS